MKIGIRRFRFRRTPMGVTGHTLEGELELPADESAAYVEFKMCQLEAEVGAAACDGGGMWVWEMCGR